jgi:hypothetical protein
LRRECLISAPCCRDSASAAVAPTVDEYVLDLRELSVDLSGTAVRSGTRARSLYPDSCACSDRRSTSSR